MPAVTGRPGAATKKPPDAVVAICPGVWAIPVVIPIPSLHHTNVYVLETRGGLALVDAGWSDDYAKEALTRGLGALGAGLSDVRNVIVTHAHLDHYGLADWVRSQSGAVVALHEADAGLLVPAGADDARLVEEMTAWLHAAGIPGRVLARLGDPGRGPYDDMRQAQPDVLLRDGDRPVSSLDLTCIHTPGHTPGHICLHSQRLDVLFAGDHVLPRITPHVGYHPQAGDNPLRDFLASLDKLKGLEPGVVAPGHEWQFGGLDRRLDEIVEHHRARLRDVLRLVEQGAHTLWEISSGYPWRRPFESFDPASVRAALSEVHAHLVLLEANGHVLATAGPPTVWRREQMRTASGMGWRDLV